MNAKEKIFCGIACLMLLGGTLTAPAAAAGTVDGIASDTTNPVTRAVGQQYRFTVTPPKNAKISYTVGNGGVLGTFVAGRPTQNPDGTVTYSFGFECRKEGDTGVYITTGGKAVRLFSVEVQQSPSAQTENYQELQDAVDNGHQPWRLDPAEVAAECIAENKLHAETDTWNVPASVTDNPDGTVTVLFKKNGKPTIEVVVFQPLKRPDSIWAVRRWTDLTTGAVHVVG